MTATTPGRRPNLPAAVHRLRSAIDRLITPTTGYQNNAYIEAPGLYTQLKDAVELGQQSNTGSGRGSKSRPPFWTDAAVQLHNIDLMIKVWCRSAGTTVVKLRTLSAKTWTVEDTDEVRRKAGIINAWADDIDTLLNQSHVQYISAACPCCGAATAQKRDSAGELIRSPALQVIAEYGCTCQQCGYFWAPDKYIDLCQQLGLPLPAGVLE
ncbi:hypothetical protein OG976_09420 [Mycobacterium sp. NBC_00419]|uniref:DUF7341 domain-containing protein n=1 Tax=Mycobacterium sp. NBC_00419 TaxID=2975989 RepID=UPI002E1B0F92